MTGAYSDGVQLWTSFGEALIRIRMRDVGDPDDEEVVLTVGGSVPDLGWAALAHVVTAWNPGREAAADANGAANRRLGGVLADTGLEVRAATGESPDGSWVEESFVIVGLTRAQAVRIGRDFGQLAIFEIDREAVRLISCDVD